MRRTRRCVPLLRSRHYGIGPATVKFNDSPWDSAPRELKHGGIVPAHPDGHDVTISGVNIGESRCWRTDNLSHDKFADNEGAEQSATMDFAVS